MGEKKVINEGMLPRLQPSTVSERGALPRCQPQQGVCKISKQPKASAFAQVTKTVK